VASKWSARGLGGGLGRWAAIAALALSTLAQADAQSVPAPPARDVAGVTVHPAPDKKTVARQVDAYVAEITRGPDSDSLMLWNDPICPLVAGLATDQGEAMLRRLSEIATAAGAPLGPQTCAVNLYVVVAPDPDRVLAAWHRRDHGMFGAAEHAMLQRFLYSSRPVRVWYNNAVRGAGGSASVSDPTAFGGASQVVVPIASRLQFATLRTLRSVVIVVDADQVKAITVAQLSDYIGMLALTHIDPDVNVGTAPSILRLFDASADARPDGLTTWDAAFLKALYHSDPRAITQRAGVTRMVVRAVTH